MEVNRRARYGWMALGGLMCLFGLVAICKWRDSSRAYAQPEAKPPISDKAKASEPVPPPPGDEEPPVKEPASAPLPSPSPDTGFLPPLPADHPRPPSSPAVPAVTPPPDKTPPPLGSDPRPIMIPSSATQPAAPKGEPSTPPPPPGPPGGGPVPPPGETPLPPVKVTETKGDPLVAPIKADVKDHPDEPPLAPTPGPMITYRLPRSGETFRTLAKKTLGTQERWGEIHKLNPTIKADASLVAGTIVRLPADACVQDEAEAVRPLPSLRPRPAPKVKVVLPLTGTYPLTLDDNKGLTLPKAILTQLGNCDTVLVSPGSDKCLWLTNQAHLDRLAAKLDKSPARESDIRNFKRLYYAQVAKMPVKDGRIVLTDKLAEFAELHQEVVLVGIDDHFEVWDAARWRRYTQTKQATMEE